MQSKDEGTKITVGKSVPEVKKLVTQEMINKWAQVSGDFNPLHVDPEFGKKTFFGTNIAQGPLILSFVIEMMTRWLGSAWLSGGRLENIRLVSPVPPNTEVTLGGNVTKMTLVDGNENIECEIFVKNKEEKLIVTGNAFCRL